MLVSVFTLLQLLFMIVPNRHSVVAKEGWLIITIHLSAIIMISFLQSYLALLLGVLAIFLFYSYRDPIRQVLSSLLGVISPVDGKIFGINHVFNSWIEKQFLKTGLQINKMGVFSFVPIEGKLI